MARLPGQGEVDIEIRHTRFALSVVHDPDGEGAEPPEVLANLDVYSPWRQLFVPPKPRVA